VRDLLGSFWASLKFVSDFRYSTEFLRKIFLRLSEARLNEEQVALEWAKSRTTNWNLFIQRIPKELLNEMHDYLDLEYQSDLVMCTRLKDEQGIDLGGGGHVGLIFLTTRIQKPKSALETGVAAGHSSKAILSAMSTNQQGILYSSDFPYFRFANAEKFIGYVLPTNLKSNWKLYLRGDKKNLSQILKDTIGPFQFVHYDSDKRKSSRLWFYETIKPHLDTNSILVFDDIQNDLSFKEIVLQSSTKYLVFEWENKYIGAIFQGTSFDALLSGNPPGLTNCA